MLGRALQVIGAILALLGAPFFYLTAGGRYGFAEFSQIWLRYLADQMPPKMGLLAVVAGILLVAVGTGKHRDRAAKEAAAAKELGHD